MADIPQTSFQSSQNNDPNIPQMYKDFVTGGNTPDDNEPGQNLGIDDIRARISVSVTGTKTADLIASLNIDPRTTTPAPTPNITTPVIIAQESRCHAFYRIIGLPVVATDKTFYNPGLDVIKQVDSSGKPITRKVTLTDKIDIAKKVGMPFENISQARENYAANIAQVFANGESIEAGVMSLTSGTFGDKSSINIRKFAVPFIKNTAVDPFDFTINDQTYPITTQSSLVGSKPIPLNTFQDANGNSLTSNQDNTNLFFNHQHIIVPFMVDPRIDFSVWSNDSKISSGVSRRIAVPFVPNASFLKSGSYSNAARPLIEKVITDRMSQYNNSIDAGTLGVQYIQYVQNIKSIQTDTLGGTSVSSIFSNSAFKTSQQAAFVQYVFNIQAMMYKLKEVLKIVHGVQGKYYFLPIPSITGPDGGGSIRSVPLNQNFSASLITPNDLNIILNQLQVFFANLNTGVTQANAVPDRGSYAFGGFQMTFDSNTSQSLGNYSANTMTTLSNQRDAEINKALDALQVIEMIMGEFSGLGLCDIMAIVGALYVMPLASVIGFLDDDAYARAGVVLNQSLPKRNSITTSMMDLAQFVNGFYQIEDSIFSDYIGNNGLNQ